MTVDEAMQRHPAGKLKREAEKSPHSLGWALGMAKKLGAVERDKEIIALLTPIRQRFMGKGFEEEIVADTLGQVIALIKGENK